MEKSDIDISRLQHMKMIASQAFEDGQRPKEAVALARRYFETEEQQQVANSVRPPSN